MTLAMGGATDAGAARPGLARIAAVALPGGLALFLALVTILPITALLMRSLFDRTGAFVGAANFIRYAREPGLSVAAWNSVSLSALTTGIVIGLAFPYAYALTRSRMPGRGFFRVVSLLPLLAPSLLPAFGLVYLFGNQGVLKGWLMGSSLYGPIGIVIGSVIHAFPQAVLIIAAGLMASDARLYEAARALRAGPWRVFATVTLSSCRYAVVSAALVVFVNAFTDFGIPTVVGGSTNMLATDIYKLVIGRFDFEMGAVVGLLLLAPAVAAYLIDRAVRQSARASISGKSVPLEPQANAARDGALLLFCGLVALALIGVIGMAIYGSLVRFWPYNLSLGFHNYERLLSDDDERRSLVNSLILGGSTALLGTLLVMLSGWTVARKVGHGGATQVLHAIAMVPVAVPGLVLGLGYVFFFNNPANPLHFLQGGMPLIVLCTIAHFYTVPHLMAVNSLMQLDREIDMASQALRAGPLRTARVIHWPVMAPTLLEIAGYFFVNAMTTVTALIFLFNAQTRVASIAVVNMIEGSRIGQAAALAVLIMAVSVTATLLQLGIRSLVLQRQSWRKRSA
ncbi:MAG: putative 2-aminoethylphosphonate ABC transporter permease subunit [Beijerinckiaceae bacterium]